MEDSGVRGTALIVGGGVGGMSAALALKRIGVKVELIDADPAWRVYGAGISLTGISLRASNDLGLLDEVRRRGFVGCGLRGRTPTVPLCSNPRGPRIRSRFSKVAASCGPCCTTSLPPRYANKG